MAQQLMVLTPLSHERVGWWVYSIYRLHTLSSN